MHLTRAPYFIDYGEYRDFRYFQSDHSFLNELNIHCPELFANKWAVCTLIDGSTFNLPDTFDGYSVCKLSSNSDLPWGEEGIEYYFFDDRVSVESLKILIEVQPFDENRLSDIDVSKFDKNWDQLHAVKAAGYLFFGQYSTFIFRDKSSVQPFIDSAFYRKIPVLHIDEEIARRRYLRNLPTTNGRCTQKGCKRNRVVYGIHCPKHHYQMLKGDLFLDEIFDDPLPDGKRHPISLHNMINSDRLVLGITALLIISFIALILCFVLTTTK